MCGVPPANVLNWNVRCPPLQISLIGMFGVPPTADTLNWNVRCPPLQHLKHLINSVVSQAQLVSSSVALPAKLVYQVIMREYSFSTMIILCLVVVVVCFLLCQIFSTFFYLYQHDKPFSTKAVSNDDFYFICLGLSVQIANTI